MTLAEAKELAINYEALYVYLKEKNSPLIESLDIPQELKRIKENIRETEARNWNRSLT